MSLDIRQMSLFELVQDTHRLLQEKENLEGQYIDVVVRIGQNLNQMRPHKPYGEFISWVEAEFNISRQSANDYIHIASVYGANVQRVGHLPLRVVSLLAAPSTPEQIRTQVESGEIPATLPAIREAKRELQQPIQQTKPAIVTPITQPIFKTPTGHYEEEDIDEPLEGEYVPEVVTLAQEEIVQQPTTLAWDEPGLPKETLSPPAPMKSAALVALQSSESNEWYTPVQYVEAARALMGAIDVDPASNAFANEKVQATTYYDIEMNGLNKHWQGRIWLNPPYGRDGGDSNQEIWTRKLIEQFASGSVTEAVLLVNANTEAKWFQPLYDYPICFTNHRIRFYTREGAPTQPTQGNAFIYFGWQEDRFAEIFEQFGTVMVRRAKSA